MGGRTVMVVVVVLGGVAAVDGGGGRRSLKQALLSRRSRCIVIVAVGRRDRCSRVRARRALQLRSVIPASARLGSRVTLCVDFRELRVFAHAAAY